MAKNLILLLASLILPLMATELYLQKHRPPIAGPSFTEYDPILGNVVRKNVAGWRATPEFYARVSTNSLGMRGRAQYRAWPRDALLFVGDSFTFGIGVSDGEEFPDLISRKLESEPKLAGIPVLNLGIGENGNGRWLRMLMRQPDFPKPKLVVLQLLENDFGDNRREHFFHLNDRGQLTEQPLPYPKPPLRLLQGAVEFFPGLDRLYLTGLIRHVIGTQLQLRLSIQENSEVKTNKQGWQSASEGPVLNDGQQPLIGSKEDSSDLLTYQIVQRTLSICRQRNWRVLGILPGISPLRRSRLKSLFSEVNAEVVELPSKPEAPQLYYESNGHWNPAGHRASAEAIYPQILKAISQNPQTHPPRME